MSVLHHDLFEGNIQPKLSILREISTGDATRMSDILYAREDLAERFIMMVQSLNIMMCANDPKLSETVSGWYIETEQGWRHSRNIQDTEENELWEILKHFEGKALERLTTPLDIE